ncbi:hypothetical protein ACS0TY_025331 [Phlomoides rotata]
MAAKRSGSASEGEYPLQKSSIWLLVISNPEGLIPRERKRRNCDKERRPKSSPTYAQPQTVV